VKFDDLRGAWCNYCLLLILDTIQLEYIHTDVSEQTFDSPLTVNYQNLLPETGYRPHISEEITLQTTTC